MPPNLPPAYAKFLFEPESPDFEFICIISKYLSVKAV